MTTPFVTIGEVAREVSVRPSYDQVLPVYSVTKHAGFVPSLEFFSKQVFSKNISGYKVVRRNQFAYATIHLDEGSLGLLVDSESALISPMYTVFKVDTERVYPPYLYRALRSPRMLTMYARLGKGSVHRRKAISFDRLASLLIPLPNLQVQRRIADTLDKADAIRRMRKEAIALTEELLRSAFLEMFGDPVTNPKGWPLSTFGDQLDVLEYGPRFYNEKYSDDGVRIVRITDLDSSGRLDFSAMPRLAVEDRDLSRYVLRPGDLIFARSGATVGKTALSMPGDPESIPGAYFIRLRLRHEVRPLFAREVLASDRIQKIIVSRSRQSAQQNFSGPGIRELPLPVPPVELQQRLETIAEGRRALLDSCRRAEAESSLLFNSLLAQAFAGQMSDNGLAR